MRILICRYVVISKYIRWKNNYYECELLRNISFMQAITKCSFSACVKWFVRTIYANQEENKQTKAALIAQTDDIKWLTSDKLMHATFFYRILWVCILNLN